MAKHYHTGEQSNPHEMLKLVAAFLGTCRSPALLAYGEDPIPLEPESYSLEVRSARLWVDAWHEDRNISRRILGIDRQATGTLDVAIHRFAGAPGKLTFLDLDRPQTARRVKFFFHKKAAS